MSTSTLETTLTQSNPQSREQVFDAFRRWGYLQAQLDPLQQYLLPQPLQELNQTGEFADQARAIYCGSDWCRVYAYRRSGTPATGFRSAWRRPAAAPDSQHALDLLVEADIFEQVIQKRYLGTKRFSLEGVTALIPFLDAVLNSRRANEVRKKSVMAMSHRGRLNVMVNTLGKSAVRHFLKV